MTVAAIYGTKVKNTYKNRQAMVKTKPQNKKERLKI